MLHSFLKSKRVHAILLLVFIHLIFLFPLVHPGVHNTHDGENHLARFGAYKRAFLDGHIPPRWAGSLNHGYGIPVFNFFYPLPGYLASILSFAGFTLEDSLKALFALAFIIAPIGMYLFLNLFTTRSVSLLAAMLYGLAPYQFLNIYVRGDIGESLALSIIPFALFFYTNGVKTKSLRYTIIGGSLAALVILAHHGIGLMSAPFLLLAAIANTYKYRAGITNTGSFIFFWFGISAFFWIPALTEHKYTLAHLFIGDMYTSHFISLPRAISSTWGFNADVNTIGGQAPQIGITAFLIVSYSLLTAGKRIKNFLVLVSLLTFITSLLLVINISDPLWRSISILQKYQFPWRFIALSTLTVPIIVGLLFRIKNKVITGLLMILIIAHSFPFTQVKNYTQYPDEWYMNFPGTTFYHGESLTRWSDGEARSHAQNPVDVIGGTAGISEVSKKTHYIDAAVKGITDSTLRINTMYYPGWRVFIDSQETPIQFQDPNSRGVITFSVPSGIHQIHAKFTETKLRLLADGISLSALILLLIVFIKPTIIYREKILLHE